MGGQHVGGQHQVTLCQEWLGGPCHSPALSLPDRCGSLLRLQGVSQAPLLPVALSHGVHIPSLCPWDPSSHGLHVSSLVLSLPSPSAWLSSMAEQHAC